MTNTSVNDQPAALSTLKVLADDTRWRLLGELRRSDRQVGELVAQLKLPQNLVSYHLGLLRQAGLVQARRSDADARAIYYGLDLAMLAAMYEQIGASLILPQAVAPNTRSSTMVLFLCTANSARSQMAEGWLRYLSNGHVSVRSVGVQPGTLHPLAVQVMAEVGVDIGHQRAKGRDALVDIVPDVVVSVCDVAREQCPDWPGTNRQLHWSIPDPVRVQGSLDSRTQVFRDVRDQLRQRVEALLALLPALAEPQRS
jgi:thioredoxin type arsenate reductase